MLKELSITLTEIDNLSLQDFNLLLSIISFRNEKDEIEYKKMEQKKRVKNIM